MQEPNDWEIETGKENVFKPILSEENSLLVFQCSQGAIDIAGSDIRLEFLDSS